MKNLKLTFTLVAVLVASFMLAPLALADGYRIENPQARPSLGVAKNSAAFFTIHNDCGRADKLISVESDVARKVELHTHLKENGVFKMRPIKAITIPANGKVELKSGGLHVMMIGVHSKLKVGDEVSLKLNFERGKSVVVTVPVMKIGGHKKKMHSTH